MEVKKLPGMSFRGEDTLLSAAEIGVVNVKDEIHHHGLMIGIDEARVEGLNVLNVNVWIF